MLPKRKRQLPKKPPYSKQKLLFDDFQDFHGASLDTDAAGDALGSGAILGHDHNLHGASLNALTAGNTLLLVDHVHTGLGVLGDGFMLTGAHALAALDADIGLCTGALSHDLDAAQIGIKFLIKCHGAGADTLQTCHTFSILLNNELLHS